ncbi:MAG: hypothetical protein HQL31_07075 [Planctomycetes bacterium]|nr:hypothetical protein [Planctomycetota bacterium]
MRAILFCLLVLSNSGCWLRNHMFIHEDEQAAHSGKPILPHPVLLSSSFSEIHQGIRENGPPPGSCTQQEGWIVLSGPGLFQRFDFKSLVDSEHFWNLELMTAGETVIQLEKRGDQMQLVAPALGEDVKGGVDQIGERLALTPWGALLGRAVEALPYQEFNPRLNWRVEQDGIKHMIFSRILQHPDHPMKIDLYINKLHRVVTRRLEISLDHLDCDTRFSSYMEVDSTLMPRRTTILLPRSRQSARIYLRSGKILPGRQNGQLKLL